MSKLIFFQMVYSRPDWLAWMGDPTAKILHMEKTAERVDAWNENIERIGAGVLIGDINRPENIEEMRQSTDAPGLWESGKYGNV